MTGPTTATVGPAGGDVSLAGGDVRLSFPAGAVGDETPVTATPASNAPAAPAGQSLIAGTAFQVGAGGAALLQPVTVTLRYDAEAVAQQGMAPAALFGEVAIYVRHNGSWEKGAGCVLNESLRTVSCEFTTLGLMAMFQTTKPSQSAPTATLIRITPSTKLAGGEYLVSAEATAELEVTAGDAPVTDVALSVSGIGDVPFSLASPIPAGTQLLVLVPFDPGSAPNGEYTMTFTITDDQARQATVTATIVVSRALLTIDHVEVLATGSVLSPEASPIVLHTQNGHAYVTFTIDVTAGATAVCGLSVYGTRDYSLVELENPTGIADPPISFPEGCVAAGTSADRTLTVNARNWGYNTGTGQDPIYWHFAFGTTADASTATLTTNDVYFDILP